MAGRKRRRQMVEDTAPVRVGGPDYPATPPSLRGGWSERIVEVPDALVVPTPGAGMVQTGGVHAADGSFCHMAAHWRRGRALLVPGRTVPEAEEMLPGRWMWGGLLLNHFGHFLTETTPRLWALPDLEDRVEGIVFVHKRQAEATEFHRKFLALLGTHLPIRVVDRPTRIGTLFVPGQGFGIGRISMGTPRFREVFRSRFAPEVAAEGPERLYVSRSALGPRRGGALGENLFEEQLARSGYEVFHPQQHPIEVQIARYRAAREIVALDGSALHLVAFAGREGQRVAMVRRRSSSMSNAIALHLGAFLGRAPDVIDAIRADWVLRGRAGADRFSMGEIDLPRLGAKLAELGYVDETTLPWPGLDPEWRDDEVRRLRDEAGLDFVPLVREGSET